jgi:prepilin-type processing-associated H-X9-DG protein
VIGIIALLVSILLPALNRARASAATVQCASNMRQIAIGVTGYATDNKGRLPPSHVAAGGTLYPNGWYWPNELVRLKYVPQPNSYTGGGVGSTTLGLKTIFNCPEGDLTIDSDVSTLKISLAQYPTDGRNNLAEKVYTSGQLVIPTWYQLSAKLTANTTKRGTAKATPFVGFFTDGGRSVDADLADPAFTRSVSLVRRSAQTAMVLEGAEGHFFSPKFIAARHGKRTTDGKNAFTNVAYFDGHVAPMPTAKWFTQGDFTPVADGTVIYLADGQK